MSDDNEIPTVYISLADDPDPQRVRGVAAIVDSVALVITHPSGDQFGYPLQRVLHWAQTREEA